MPRNLEQNQQARSAVFNSSPEVIRLVVLMYVRYPLSLRNVEDLLFERGIDICHETVRLWWNRFGPSATSTRHCAALHAQAADSTEPGSDSHRINFEYRRWMAGGAASLGRCHSGELQRFQIQSIDEGLDRSNRVVCRHIIVERCWQQIVLPAIFPLHETAHPKASLSFRKTIPQIYIFTQRDFPRRAAFGP